MASLIAVRCLTHTRKHCFLKASRNTVPDPRSSRTDRACAGKQSQMLLLRYKYLGPLTSVSPALRPIPIQSMGKDYSLTSFGTNTKGNNWSARDHGTKGKGYCYSNSDGSYYYKNPNGSTYFNSGKGFSKYTTPNGNAGNPPPASDKQSDSKEHAAVGS